MNQTALLGRLLAGLIDASTPTAPAWNIETQREGKPPAWNYIDGCMIKAILDIYRATAHQPYFEFAEQFVSHYIAEDGAILGYRQEDYNCDHINGGKSLFLLYQQTGKEKYKKAIHLLRDQMRTHPRTKSGNFWHKKIYPQQIWLDGLYMVQPFLMQYDATFAKGECLQDIFSQFETAHRLMQDTQTGLFYHGYDDSRESFWCDKQTGLSPHFWTRSLGWYGMALADTLDHFDEQSFYGRKVLMDHFKGLMDALLKQADPETGLFYQVTNQGGREGNYLETSGSAAIAYCLLKGARQGYLPHYYAQKGEAIVESLVQHKLHEEDGIFSLKDVCLVAGLGGMPGQGAYKIRDGSFAYYISEPRVRNDAKGVAPLLFCWAELLLAGKGV